MVQAGKRESQWLTDGRYQTNYLSWFAAGFAVDKINIDSQACPSMGSVSVESTNKKGIKVLSWLSWLKKLKHVNLPQHPWQHYEMFLL